MNILAACWIFGTTIQFHAIVIKYNNLTNTARLTRCLTRFRRSTSRVHTAVDILAIVCVTGLRWYDCSIASDHVWVWQCGIDTSFVAVAIYMQGLICSIIYNSPPPSSGQLFEQLTGVTARVVQRAMNEKHAYMTYHSVVPEY